jgi:hypothetical protein
MDVINGCYGWMLWMDVMDGCYRCMLQMDVTDGCYGWMGWLVYMLAQNHLVLGVQACRSCQYMLA